jgi:hypothetical protein
LRRYPKVAFAVALSLATLAAARGARAGSMDITPERLYIDSPNMPGGVHCQDVAAKPEIVLHSPFPAKALPNSYPCLPNNVSWSNMMSELGMAIAPTAFHAARTTGLGGFALSFEASFTHINADAVDSTGTQYWHAGTQGPIDPAKNQYSIVNKSPDSILQVYSLKARKGLAYGFEIAGSLGYLANTSLWVGGGDVRWALLEGFRTGLLGYVPDFSIGGGVRTVGGSPKFFLTTVGIDAQLSKPITLEDSAVLTPYIGAQRVIIFADSTVVDFAPNYDPLQPGKPWSCGWLGPNIPDNKYSNPALGKLGNGQPPNDGTPICENKLSNGAANNSGFNDYNTFAKARIHRWRGIAGLNYRFEVMYLAAQFAMDVTDPSAENANMGISGDKQWTMSLEAGVSF